MKPASFKALLFPKPYSPGRYPVYIRVYQNGKSSYVSTGHIIPRGAWNPETSELWESKTSITWDLIESLSREELKALREKLALIIILPEASKINSDIRLKIEELKRIQNKLAGTREVISPAVIKARAERKKKILTEKNDLFTYLEKAAKKKSEQGDIRTSAKYAVLLGKLKEFRKGDSLPPELLTTEFLDGFQLFLGEKGYHQNYIRNILLTLRSVIQKNVIGERGIIPIEKNPFILFKMNKIIPSSKVRLDSDEIRRIEGLELENGSIGFHVRNAFIFSFYTAGISVSDLMLLRWANISEYGRLNYFIGRTGRERSISLIPAALKILSFYETENKKSTDFIFPFLEKDAVYADLTGPDAYQKTTAGVVASLFKDLACQNTLFNRHLKKIAVMANIGKNITSMSARHSFAVIAKEKISVYEIRRLLGHSAHRVTEVYLKSLDTGLPDNSLKKVFD